MPTDPIELGKIVIRRCLDAGFSLAGVCEARPTERAKELADWLAQGKQGEMTWMSEQAADRLDVRRILPEARSVIVVADQYAARGEEPTPTRDAEGAVGVIARYARGRDYHEVMRQRLHALADKLRAEIPGAKFRTTVDTAPVLEREQAARAGIGWVGKHTLIIHPRAGSWFLLGCILTSLELKPDPATASRSEDDGGPIADHCGTCTRCIDACPTGAITPRDVDARRCVSYLTIEHRSLIDPALHDGIGQRIFGCDVCQEVCPHNAEVDAIGAEPRVNPRYRSARAGFNLLAMLNWTAEDRQYGLGVSSMKRATLAMFKRNALIAAGNALREREEPALRERIAQISKDAGEEDLVRLTALQVLRRLPAGPPPMR